MINVRTEMNQGEGYLPGSAPLANPYVPFQLEHPVEYEPGKALVRGTLFVGLDLPFKGMVNRNPLPNTKMTEMQKLAFAVQELALYLDTHADDKKALEEYHRYQKQLAILKAEYTKSKGPVSHNDVTCGERYAWLSDPWPWEYAKNREV